MKRFIAVVVVVLVAAAYVGGFWPEHARRAAADDALARAQAQLASAERQIRLGELLGQQLRLADAIDARNFGDAAGLSSAFFNRVQQEAAQTSDPDLRQTLDAIQRTRDQVTTAIARTDPAVAGTLREHELALRRALGYPVAPAETPAPPTPPSSAPVEQ